MRPGLPEGVFLKRWSEKEGLTLLEASVLLSTDQYQRDTRTHTHKIPLKIGKFKCFAPCLRSHSLKKNVMGEKCKKLSQFFF